MNVIETRLPGVVIIEPAVFTDHRGFFVETFREDVYAERVTQGLKFVQDNHSRSVRGVLRGLHFQTRRPQGKLLRVVRGEIFDVAVDIRPQSPTYGRWVGEWLSGENKRQLYVPPGFAHGFQVVSDTVDVLYKCTDYYDPGGESGLAWNDPEVAVEWPLGDPEISEKDRKLPSLARLREGETD
jgi:dTDP-4-dehydrorhamnose 3,5-epimerase